MLKFILITLKPSYLNSLRHHLVDLIYDIAPLVFDLAAEVFIRDTRLDICRHFSHSSLHVVDVGFRVDLALKLLSASFAFTVHHPFRKFKFLDGFVLGLEDVTNALKS